jgi:hypothetical protein
MHVYVKAHRRDSVSEGYNILPILAAILGPADDIFCLKAQNYQEMKGGRKRQGTNFVWLLGTAPASSVCSGVICCLRAHQKLEKEGASQRICTLDPRPRRKPAFLFFCRSRTDGVGKKKLCVCLFISHIQRT